MLRSVQRRGPQPYPGRRQQEAEAGVLPSGADSRMGIESDNHCAQPIGAADSQALVRGRAGKGGEKEWGLNLKLEAWADSALASLAARVELPGWKLCPCSHRTQQVLGAQSMMA